MKRDEETDAEVTWEDQQMINEFGRLSGRRQELRADIKRLQVRCVHAVVFVSNVQLLHFYFICRETNIVEIRTRKNRNSLASLIANSCPFVCVRRNKRTMWTMHPLKLQSWMMMC
jgi:hypothetical protein